MEFRHLDQKEEKVWEALVQSNPAGGFMQSFFWSDFKRKTGWDTFKIGVYENNKLKGGAVIMKFHFSKNKNFLYIPEGPILAYQNAQSTEYFHALLSEIDVIADLEGDELTTHIRIEPRLIQVPDFFNKFKKAPYNMEPRNTLMLDLQKNEEQLLNEMKPKGRYNIKVAERFDIEIKKENSAKGIEEFLNIYKTTTERNKFEGKDDRYFHALINHLFATHQGDLFFAVIGKKVLATALVIFYGDRATYFFGGSTNEDREKMAPYKLHWEIARYAKKQGYHWYDLWGIAPKTANSTHDWYGLTQFKKKFGGEEFDFIGAYDFIYNQKLYQEFLKESGEI